jgi:quinol monooxygenase YgiN
MILAHDVYFRLKDASPAAREALAAACRKYLAGHEGTVFFAAGTRADESLHVHFRDRAAHDAYQDHPRHKEFIAENQANWASVRVFDSWIAPAT